MKRQLTDKQIRALRFVYDYINSNDYAPTSKEIGEALGISTTVAYDRIRYLLGHDCLRRLDTGQYGRNFELTEKGISLCESLSKK
jgi:predicted transcriptional regulator